MRSRWGSFTYVGGQISNGIFSTEHGQFLLTKTLTLGFQDFFTEQG